MKLPQIDLSDFLILLRHEGRSELSTACLSKMGGMSILREWDVILRSLEKIVSKLKVGTEVSEIVTPIKGLAKAAGGMASLASQVLSFVPGPIGILCSLINAIVCFCTLPFPVNIGNGLLELLGCIPGGKVLTKGTSKMAPAIEKILKKLLEENKQLREIVEHEKEIAEAVKNFTKRLKQATPVQSSPKKVVGSKLDINEADFYGQATKGNSPFSPSVIHEVSQMERRYSIYPTRTNLVGNPYSNLYSHLW